MPDHAAVLSPAKQALLARLRGGGARDIAPIPRLAGDGPFPLSYAQERVYFAGLLAPGLRLFNLVAGARLPFVVPAEAVEQRLAEITARHDALRTSIRLVGDEPKLVIARSVPVAVPVADLSGTDPADTLAVARQAALTAGLEPYD